MSTSQVLAPNPKALGAFYTPATIAEAMAAWVVRNGLERLLEPSAGAGALIDAAIARADHIRGKEGNLKFLACDIDPTAIEKLVSRLPQGSDVRSVDFLQLSPSRAGRFDGVIANPPFTRNHSIPAPMRSRLRERFGTSGAAGLWVHFLLHAVEFLKDGGRLAAVIPASGLFTVYGQNALERLASKFRHIEIRRIADKPSWVNGAEERGSLILAEGFGQGTSAVPSATSWSSINDTDQIGGIRSNVFDQLLMSAVDLESVANLSIGAVTGCNAVFLLNECERTNMEIGLRDTRLIVSRTKQVPGLKISSSELNELSRLGQRTRILLPNSIEKRESGTRRQLAKITKEQRRNTVWLKKRSPWWRVNLGEPCDAVFTYMNDFGPRIVIACGEIYCTNTLHHIKFQQPDNKRIMLSATLSTITTFGQLSAERLGRSYGGGILKFELREARKTPILISKGKNLSSAVQLADQALREGNRDKARAIADKTLLAPRLGKDWKKKLREMERELILRRSLRRKSKLSDQ